MSLPGPGDRGALRHAGGALASGTLGALAALAIGLVLSGPAALGQSKKLNPHTGKVDAIKEGRTLYLQYGCSGCHGLGGGGGMAVPLIDDIWKFGSDDGTLYKLIKGEIAQQTMPKVWGAMPDEEIWKILAYIRSLYAGEPGRVDW